MLSDQLKRTDLAAPHKLLLMWLHANGPATPRKMQDALGYQPRGTRYLLKRLRDENLVDCKGGPEGGTYSLAAEAA